MDDIKKQLIVLSLISNLKSNGSWCGETHIQKNMYFLQELLDVPTGFDFILYKHGPFSFDFRDYLGEMRGNLLLELEIQPYPYGPSYILSSTAVTMIKKYGDFISKYEPYVHLVTKTLSHFGVAELERFATALYVSQEGVSGPDVGKRAERITELKPHVSIMEAQTAVKAVDEFTQEAKAILN